MFHVEYNRIAIETQEVIANKVKESIQHEQQYDKNIEATVVEQVMDAILGDTPGASLIKESIRASNNKNKRVKGELTIAETMKKYQESGDKASSNMTSSNINTDELHLMQMFDKVIWEYEVIVSDERGNLEDVDYQNLLSCHAT